MLNQNKQLKTLNIKKACSFTTRFLCETCRNLRLDFATFAVSFIP